jgi:hypothetical protein
MRAGVIGVVRHEGELFFESAGVFVDRLDANDFYLASIRIVRDVAEFESGLVFAMSEEDPFPVFIGLDKVFKDLPDRSYRCEELFPDYFEEGDEIHFTLSHPFDWEIDYRQMYAEDQIAIQLAPLVEELLSRDDEESIEYELLSQRYCIESERLFSHFKFPLNPILRRIE